MGVGKLMKSEYKNKIGIAIIIVAVLGIAYFGGIGGMGMFDTTYDLSDYSTWSVKDYDGTLHSMGDSYLIDDASESKIIVFVDWNVQANPVYMQCKLYRGTVYGAGVWTETGVEVSTASADDYKWEFSLDACPIGEYNYYIEVYGRFATTEDDRTTHILGNSYIFQIDNPEEAVIDSPVITESPDDQDAYFYAEVQLTWSYVVYSVSEIDISVNGVSQYSTLTSLSMNSVEQFIQEDISVGGTGIYNVVFSITPIDVSIVGVSETTVLNVGDATIPTTTDTTTTTTTTSPPPPPPIGYDFSYVLIGGVIAVVVLGFVMLKGRREGY